MRKQRIAYLITGLNAGGAETMLYHLLRRMDRERIEPSVISLMDQGKLGKTIEELGVPVHCVGMPQGQPSLGSAWKLRKMLQDAKPDLIQGWMYHSNLAAQFFNGFSRTPVCWCIQNSFQSFAAEKPLTRMAIRLSAKLSRLPARIVFVSHTSRAQHERLGFASDRSCVIPNGADPDLFHPSSEAREAIRQELGLPSGSLLIGLMARYHPQKDHTNFIQAAALLARSRPHVHFVLAGAGIDEGNETLRETIRKAELQNHVHLLGQRDDMPKVTAALDIATSSSSYGEALSLAVAEAMACAVPCVVTDVGDSGRLVAETGAIVPPQDAVALAEGWVTLLNAGDERRREMGIAARQRIEKYYSLHSIVNQYEELYRNLGENSRRRACRIGGE